MDSGNSGSVSSSGDEEYNSVPASFLNPHAQIGCFTSYPHSSQLVSPSSHHHQIQTHHPYVFDVSPTYLQPNSNPNIPLLNLEAAPPRSDQPPNCTVPAVSSAPAPASSLQLRHEYDMMNNNAGGSAAGVSGSQAARNPKKRTRASRRAPTTVLTTDTSNFRAMVQEFTGIPAPPFSSSSYSRRLDLLAASSSFRSSSSSSFYPLRPSPHKLPSNNPSLLSSSPSTLLPNHNMGDANLASTTTTNANNSSPSIVNYQLIPNTDHVGGGGGGGVPFNHPQHMLSMQVLPFQTPISLHPFPNSLPASGFNPKSQSHSQPSLSIPSLEDQLGLGMRHPQPHLDLVTSHTHAHLSTSEADQPTPLTTTIPHAQAPTDHPFTSFPPTTCKLVNFSASSSSTFNLDNNNNNLDNSSARGEVGR